jgi:hypothetical protein
MRVGLSHHALGCGDVGAALQKLRWNAKGNVKRRSSQGHDCDGKRRSGLANQERDRMLELRAQNAKIGIMGADSFQLDFCLRDGFVAVNAGFIEHFGEFQGMLVSYHSGIEKLFERVLPAKLEVIDGGFGLSSQTGILKVCRARYIGSNGVTNATPQIGCP